MGQSLPGHQSLESQANQLQWHHCQQMWPLFAVENLAISDFTPIITFLTSIYVCKMLCDYTVLNQAFRILYVYCQDTTFLFLFFFKYNTLTSRSCGS